MAENQHPRGLSSPRTSRRMRSGCRRCDHNVLLLGYLGAGKSMLVRRLTTILPTLTLPDALDTTPLPHVAELSGRRTAFVAASPPAV
jgi:predicted ATPase with chaperone activity